jgi:hypothetical protein
MSFNKIICISFALMVFWSVCYAQNTDASYKSNLPPYIVNSNQPVPVQPDTLLTAVSYNQGKFDAGHFHPSAFRFVAGLGSGLILPFAGILISTALTKGTPPEFTPGQVDSAAYLKGYLEKTCTKNRKTVILGGFTGSVITSVVIISILEAYSSMSFDWQ